MKHRLTSALILLTSAGFLSVPAVAADPAAAIKYRQATMKALAGHLGAASALAKDEVSAEGHLAVHVDALAATAKLMEGLFPAGSGQGQTSALPAIWDNPTDFAKAVAASDAAATALASTPKDDAAALGAALGAVGKTCGGCHGAFREKKQ